MSVFLVGFILLLFSDSISYAVESKESQPKEQIAIEGSSYKMKCDYTTDQPSKNSNISSPFTHSIVIWSVNGSIPQQGRKYKLMTDGLVIRNVSKEDTFINYTCTVLDAYTFTPLRFDSIKLKLSQRAGKFFESKPVANKVHVWGIMNQWVSLHCNMFSRPSPTFQWSKLDSEEKLEKTNELYKIVEDEFSSNLTIFLHNETFLGEYVCKASNNLGEFNQHFILAEGYEPKPPFIYPTYIGQNRVTIKVEPQETVQPNKTFYKVALPVTKYLVQYMENSLATPLGNFNFKKFHNRNWTTITIPANDKSQYFTRHEKGLIELQNLKGNTTYFIRCAVENDAATSNFSPAIRITTDASDDTISSMKDTTNPGTYHVQRQEYGRSSHKPEKNSASINATNNCTNPRYRKTVLRTEILTTMIEDLMKDKIGEIETASFIKKRTEENTSVIEKMLLCSISE